MSKLWPRLSLTLPGPVQPQVCQSCGRHRIILPKFGLGLWQECDEHDRPTPIHIFLCISCNLTRDAYGQGNPREYKRGLVERHPRMYIQTDLNSWIPGLMDLCSDCRWLDDLECKYPEPTERRVTGPEPVVFHVSGSKAVRGWHSIPKPPEACSVLAGRGKGEALEELLRGW